MSNLFFDNFFPKNKEDEKNNPNNIITGNSPNLSQFVENKSQNYNNNNNNSFLREFEKFTGNSYERNNSGSKSAEINFKIKKNLPKEKCATITSSDLLSEKSKTEENNALFIRPKLVRNLSGEINIIACKSSHTFSQERIDNYFKSMGNNNENKIKTLVKKKSSTDIWNKIYAAFPGPVMPKDFEDKNKLNGNNDIDENLVYSNNNEGIQNKENQFSNLMGKNIRFLEQNTQRRDNEEIESYSKSYEIESNGQINQEIPSKIMKRKYEDLSESLQNIFSLESIFKNPDELSQQSQKNAKTDEISEYVNFPKKLKQNSIIDFSQNSNNTERESTCGQKQGENNLLRKLNTRRHDMNQSLRELFSQETHSARNVSNKPETLSRADITFDEPFSLGSFSFDNINKSSEKFTLEKDTNKLSAYKRSTEEVITNYDNNKIVIYENKRIDSQQLLLMNKKDQVNAAKNIPQIELVDHTYAKQFKNAYSQTENIKKTENQKFCRAGYIINENCDIYEDRVLKNLLEEKTEILEDYKKLEYELSKESAQIEEVLARTYIARYRKDEYKIFVIKNREKKPSEEIIYRPPEHEAINNFIKKFENNPVDNDDDDLDHSIDCISDYGDQNVSVNSSYILDETKSVALSTGAGKLVDYHLRVRDGMNKILKDKNLLFSRFSDKAPKENSTRQVLFKIHKVILNVLKEYEEFGNPCVYFPANRPINYVFKDNIIQLKDWPVQTKLSYASSLRYRFNLFLCILNKIRLLLKYNTKITKREMYYQVKSMVKYEQTVSRIITDIGRMSNAGMWDLNIMCQKGLVYGNLKLIMCNGEEIHCNVTGTSIPLDITNISEIHSNAYFILVVEKESIFHKLLEENIQKRLTRPFILITGKGVPDNTTKYFLRKLWMVLTIPVFILVDADPAGISIMLNYRFGSEATAHISDSLAIPKARWIGVFPSELDERLMNCTKLTKRDFGLIKSLLKLDCVKENPAIQAELVHLQQHSIKMTIEGLMKTDTTLSHQYLSSKIINNELI